MNKLNDNLLKRHCLHARFTDEEMALIKHYQGQIRAPSLSQLARQAVLELINKAPKTVRFCTTFAPIDNDFQKKNSPCTPYKENSLSPENAHARSQEELNMISVITNDADLIPYAREFLDGLVRKGDDPAAKNPDDLRRHFRNWLPKYKAKREIESRKTAALKVEREKPDYQIEEQMRAKWSREEKAAELQRQLDEQSQAANSPEAREAAARVCAKFGKPGKREALS